MNIPKSFASNVLPLQQAPVTPYFPRRSTRTAVRSNPYSYGAFALPWDPLHMNDRVHLLRMESPFPPVLWISCTQAPLAFNARCSGGSFSQCPIPRHWDMMWVQNSHSCESLWYSYFSVCGLPTPHIQGCLYHVIPPATILMWPLCLLV